MLKAVSLLLVLALAGGAAAQDSVVALVESNPDFVQLYGRLALFPDLVAALSDPAFNGTVFAPTNEAVLRTHYKLIKAAAFDGLALTPQLLKGTLQYHVVPGVAALAADLTNGQELPTLNAEAPPLEVEKTAAGVRIKAVGSVADVTTADIAVNDAVVHVIDEMLLPLDVPDFEVDSVLEAAQLANLTSLVSAVQTAGLADALADVKGTVLAPTDDAFLPLSLAAVASNRLELTPEFLARSSPTIPALLACQARPTPVPGRACMCACHRQAARRLLVQPVQLLINGTQAYSADLANGTTLTTLEGEDLTVATENGGTFFVDVNGGRAAVLIPDVKVSDDVVVHVIDRVLLPTVTPAIAPGAPPTTAPAGAPPASAASAALASLAALAASALAAALLV
ncbi:hypothetical protein ABPG75_006591 [Micractinium tetrahymenae]